jgi:hypothetical protein
MWNYIETVAKIPAGWLTREDEIIIIIIVIISGVILNPLGSAATTGLLYQTPMIGDSDCGEIGGMKIGRGSRSTRRNPAPVPLCPP